jgi:hypothetical protein
VQASALEVRDLAGRGEVLPTVDALSTGATPQKAELTLNALRLLTPLCSLTLALLLLSLGQDIVLFAFPEAGLHRVWRLDVDAEISIPTWLASSVILIDAIALAAIATHKLLLRDRLCWHWLLLAVLFAGLSLDETAALHNALSAALSSQLKTGGFLAYAWVIPALVLCPLGLLAYLPFILDFVGRERRLLIASATLFLAGAIGLEMLGAKLAGLLGQENLLYRLSTTAEEALEAFAMLSFLAALLLYARRRIGRLEITIA